MMNLSLGEIISISISIVLGVLNIIQYYRKRGILKPISNSLVGLFNDVKNKLILCNGQRNKLWAERYPHKSSLAVRWDYDDFIFTMIESLYGFQEHIVAMCESLGISGDKVFQAINFGLTEEEKEQRKMFFERWKEYQEKQQLQPPKK